MTDSRYIKDQADPSFLRHCSLNFQSSHLPLPDRVSIILDAIANTSYLRYISPEHPNIKMPNYPLSRILNHIHILAFCLLHDIRSRDYNIELSPRNFRVLEDRHGLQDDIGLTDLQLDFLWPQLGAAMLRCSSEGGATDSNLRELMNVVMDIGGDRVRWRILLQMDSKERLSVILPPR